MTRVVVSPSNVFDFPEGGGHAWVYLQHVHGLQRSGCEVYWLERCRHAADSDVAAEDGNQAFVPD